MSECNMPSRRHFMVSSAATLASMASFSDTLAKALAVQAQGCGGLSNVKHVIFLIQENRSFDHYFGTLAGVRGFNDPRAIMLPSAKPVWYQPHGASAQVLPYHFDAANTNAMHVALNHNWKGSEATWKDWNAWARVKSPQSMGYYNRGDLPFYYALADAFTVCDAYHCSIFGPTDPNRFYSLSGHAGGNLEGIPDSKLYNVGAGGYYNGDIANDDPTAQGITWLSYAEKLQKLGVSWKVYQEWDNYGDNYLQYFKTFRVDAQGRKLTPSSPLYQRCRSLAPGSGPGNPPVTTGQYLIDSFSADVIAGRLPAVSWICAPSEYCEHPENTPNAGENFTARLLAALVAKPEVWAQTVLILTYDENDGCFDHRPPVIPPINNWQGRSTVSNQGEVYQNKEPIGLGPRVPALVISPWSKGGRVNSQLFDHTSLIRFLEEWLVCSQGFTRDQVLCPNISPWRRAVCGDLTSALNFGQNDTQWPRSVPSRADYPKRTSSNSANPPSNQVLPSQEAISGSVPKAACPLNYHGAVQGRVVGDARQFSLDFINDGIPSAWIVYSGLRADGPWHYTVETGKRIDGEVWNWATDQYQLSVQGPNGFLREFAGKLGAGTTRLDVTLTEIASSRSIQLNFSNSGKASLRVNVNDLAYGDTVTQSLDLAEGQTRSIVRQLDASRGWYDLGITLSSDVSYWRRLSGHLDGAGLDYTDPVLNGLVRSPKASPWPAPLPVPPISFTSSATQIRSGNSLTLNWSGMPPSNTHWIGIYNKGANPSTDSYVTWNYISGSSGSMALWKTLGAGDYVLGLFYDDGYEQAAPMLSLKVLP